MKKRMMIICIIIGCLVLISIPIGFSFDGWNDSKISSNSSALYTKYEGNFWFIKKNGGKAYFGNWGIDREPPSDDIYEYKKYYFPFSVPKYLYIVGNKIISVFR